MAGEGEKEGSASLLTANVHGDAGLSVGLLRSNEGQDLVGFDMKEILGMKKRAPTASERASWEKQAVFFATNREPIGITEEMGEEFGSGYVDSLRFGITSVPCPEGRPLVQREMQWAGTLTESDFKSALRDSVSRDPQRSVLLYVHGCFSDFGRSMGYGAQIHRGLDFQGPICVYSWPTVGRPSVGVGLGVIKMYRHDEMTSCMSAPQLKDLLCLLSTEVGARNIHIVAYSMGARTLMEAFRLLDPQDLAPDTGVTSHIYFMAPDVTAHFFAQVAKDFKFPKPRERVRRQPVVGEGHQLGAGSGSGVEVVAGGGGFAHAHTLSAEEEATEPKEEMGFSDSAAMGVGPGVLPPGETVFTVLDQMADIVGDTVSGIRTAGKVWREGRKQGWGELLKAVFGNEETPPDTLEALQPRRNAHIHLYAARNDFALLLSELMDSGVPQIRAGRCTTEFVLCNSRGAFDTIDASALKSGVLTTGHFYLFHQIVRADMKHVVDGKTDLPWWRQAERWRSYDYYKLRVRVPLPPIPSGSTHASVAAWKGEAEDQVHSSPLLWASP